MENTRTNKIKIFEIAVHLFAEKGYAKVSMREIADAVGIKAASIYNHYAGKEALLDSIFKFFKEQLTTKVYPSFQLSENTTPREFLENTIQATDAIFTSPIMMEISRIILKEQFLNEKIRTLLLIELIQKPREYFAGYFQQLMERGLMRRLDPVLIAKEYHSYFIYRFYENCLTPEGSVQEFANMMEEQEAHVNLFLEHFCITKDFDAS